MFRFESDSVRELHFTNGGTVVGDSNGFTADDFPAENLYEAAEWVAPKRWLNVDELPATPADEHDVDIDFNLEFDAQNAPVLVFRRATRREAIVVNNAITTYCSDASPADEPTDTTIETEVATNDVDDEPRHPEQSSMTRKVEEGREGERRLYKARHRNDGKGKKPKKAGKLFKEGKALRQQLDDLAAKAIPADVVMFPESPWTDEELNEILIVTDLEAQAWEEELDYLAWWHCNCADEPEMSAQERYELELYREREIWEDYMSDYLDACDRFEAEHGHFPWEADNWDELELARILVIEDDEPELCLTEAQYSGISIRDTMSSPEYSMYSLYKSCDRGNKSGHGWKRNKLPPDTRRERKLRQQLREHAA